PRPLHALVLRRGLPGAGRAAPRRRGRAVPLALGAAAARASHGARRRRAAHLAPDSPSARRRAQSARDRRARVKVLAIFGPTAVGKTGVAIAVAERLGERAEDPVAVSCDALQVYRGLEALSGAPTPAERARLGHRLVGVADVAEEFSAGRFARL